MEEELNYATVVFKSNVVSAQNTKNEERTAYAQENWKKATHCNSFQLVAVGLGIMCIILVLIIIALGTYLNTVTTEHNATYNNLKAQNLDLEKERDNLQTQTQELTRERENLNWTLQVILQYEKFPVDEFCPRKVCNPCRDGWKPFESSCYLFTDEKWHSTRKEWAESKMHCRKYKADLVVIGSQREQEFISNHTERYHTDRHGYWIGLSEEYKQWLWVDGSNLTLKYWMTEELESRGKCTLTIPNTDPLANWDKAGCNMKNQWICETKALIKSDSQN